MKKYLVLSSLLYTCYIATAQSFHVVDSSSSVRFSIRNFAIRVNGTFSGMQGKIVFDPLAPEKNSFGITVDASTVDTKIEKRDNHLRQEEYFDVANAPRISFISKKISRNTDSTYTVTGTMTIKHTTKTISVPFKAIPAVNGYLFSGSFQLNRRDYKVGKKNPVLGDVVALDIIIDAIKD